jgi:hypothetical protein
MNRIDRKMLVGLAFDNVDGHIRITKGENFRLYGGSDRTHVQMQRKMARFNEELDMRNKTLDQINEKELSEIAKSVGLKVKKKK